MADAGIGEGIAAEGAKSAGEAAAAGAAEAGAAEAGAGALGAGAAEAGFGTLAEGLAVDALPEAGGLTALGGDALATGASSIPSLAGAGLSEGLGSGLSLDSMPESGGLTPISSGGVDIPSLQGMGIGDSGLGYLGGGVDVGGSSPGGGLVDFGSSTAGGQVSGVPEGLGAEGVPGADLSPVPPSPAMTGGESTISKALDALGSGALKYGPLANSTIGLLRQGTGSAQKQLNAAAAPAQAVSNQLLSQFQSGQLTGSDQYAIAQWSQQQKAKIDQYYQSAGLANSSMHQSAVQQITQQAEAMRQQAVQNLLKNGLSAAGVSSPLITAGVNAAMKQDQEAQTAMSNFIATLAKMNTPTPTGSPGG